MADKLTYAQWFDRLAPAIDRLEATGWAFLPGTRWHAAMTAMGNQHNGQSASSAAVIDLLERSRMKAGPFRIPAQFGAVAYG